MVDLMAKSQILNEFLDENARRKAFNGGEQLSELQKLQIAQGIIEQAEKIVAEENEKRIKNGQLPITISALDFRKSYFTVTLNEGVYEVFGMSHLLLQQSEQKSTIADLFSSLEIKGITPDVITSNRFGKLKGAITEGIEQEQQKQREELQKRALAEQQRQKEEEERKIKEEAEKREAEIKKQKEDEEKKRKEEIESRKKIGKRIFKEAAEQVSERKSKKKEKKQRERAPSVFRSAAEEGARRLKKGEEEARKLIKESIDPSAFQKELLAKYSQEGAVPLAELIRINDGNYLYLNEDERIEIAYYILQKEEEFYLEDVYIQIDNGKLVFSEITIKPYLSESDNEEVSGDRIKDINQRIRILEELGLLEEFNEGTIENRFNEIKESKEIAEKEAEAARKAEEDKRKAMEEKVRKEIAAVAEAGSRLEIYRNVQSIVDKINDPSFSLSDENFEQLKEQIFLRMNAHPIETHGDEDKYKQLKEDLWDAKEAYKKGGMSSQKFIDCRKKLENNPIYWERAIFVMGFSVDEENMKLLKGLIDDLRIKEKAKFLIYGNKKEKNTFSNEIEIDKDIEIEFSDDMDFEEILSAMKGLHEVIEAVLEPQNQHLKPFAPVGEKRLELQKIKDDLGKNIEELENKIEKSKENGEPIPESSRRGFLNVLRNAFSRFIRFVRSFFRSEPTIQKNILTSCQNISSDTSRRDAKKRF